MIFTETILNDSFVIELEKLEDERGFFARSWDYKKFKELGLDSNLVQCNISYNKMRGTLRGMHYQDAPFEETKLIRCTRGKIFDVIIDLRPKSVTYKKWYGIEMSEDNYKMLYIPKGFAHGFQTLEDETEVSYQMSEYFMPEYARGIRWDDPVFHIDWPLEISVISKKDLSYPSFK